MAEELERSRRLIASIQREELRQKILEVLPQGHMSGLDADMVDGLHAAEILAKARVAPVLHSSGGGGGVTDHGALTGLEDDDHPQYLLADGSRGFAGNFLPAADGGYSLGDDVKRWLEALFYFEDSGGTGMWGGARIGSKIPSDDPDVPNYPLPHVDLSFLPGIGVTDDIRVSFDISDFQFVIQRRILGSGSWINILKYNGVPDPPEWQFGASFLPTQTNVFDFGADALRWRDLYFYRYLRFYGFNTPAQLPAPGFILNRALVTTYASPQGLFFAGQRSAGDYKWKNLADSFESVALLKDVTGKTYALIGTTDQEILGPAHRTKVDLTYMDRCRVVFGGSNDLAKIFYCKIQYSTDGSTWYDLTPEGASNGTTNEQHVEGSWGNIPAGALADVYIKAMGRAEDSGSSPTYMAIELQVR